MVAWIVWKKWFWGVWDNLLRFFLLNALLLLSVVALLGLAKLLGPGVGLFVLGILAAAGVVVVALLVSAQLASLADIRGSWSWGGGWHWLRRHPWALWWVPFWLLVCFILPSVAFYWRWFRQQGGGWLPLVMLLPLVWALFFLALMGQFFLAATVQLGDSWGSALKQAALLTLDNLGAALLSLLFSLLWLLPPVLLLLGPASLLFWQQVLLSILRYKYRHRRQLVKQGITGKELRRIPWSELLQEEIETIGHRTLRNTIFPWKD